MVDFDRLFDLHYCSVIRSAAILPAKQIGDSTDFPETPVSELLTIVGLARDCNNPAFVRPEAVLHGILMNGVEDMLNRPTVVAVLMIVGPAFGEEKNPELQKFQGHWVVDELVEDGKVIPKTAIKEWLPSGGRAEIVDNAIIFKSAHDGKKYVKIFSIDATKYPKGIEISTPKRKDGWGIYRFDKGKLIICLSDPKEAKPPKEFSAKAGSKRMLMVLKKSTAKAVAQQVAGPRPKPKQSGQAGRILTDAEVSKMLAGSWKLRDSAGSLYIAFKSNGTFNTVREYRQLRLFHKSFVQTPVSSGTWSVKNGNLTARVTASIRSKRVNQLFSFAVRSISARDMIFVDQLGRIGSAVKVR